METSIPVKLAHKLFEPEEDADGSLAPVIFLHGVAGNKENWTNEPQVIANKTKRKCYAVDARNHGDSEFTETYDFNMNVQDLLHFMNTIGADKSIIVGVSMGGVTAIRAALDQPERVEKFVAVDIYPKKLPKEMVEAVTGFLGLAIMSIQSIPNNLEMEEAVEFAIDFILDKIPPGAGMTLSRKALGLVGTTIFRKPDGSYGVRYNAPVILEALKNYDTAMSEPTGQYSGPALFIYGELSQFNVAGEAEDIKKLFPQAELLKFEGASHAANIEFPEKFIETLLKFL